MILDETKACPGDLVDERLLGDAHGLGRAFRQLGVFVEIHDRKPASGTKIAREDAVVFVAGSDVMDGVAD